MEVPAEEMRTQHCRWRSELIINTQILLRFHFWNGNSVRIHYLLALTQVTVQKCLVAKWRYPQRKCRLSTADHDWSQSTPKFCNDFTFEMEIPTEPLSLWRCANVACLQKTSNSVLNFLSFDRETIVYLQCCNINSCVDSIFKELWVDSAAVFWHNFGNW